MQTILIKGKAINPERLHEELETIAGYRGFSVTRAGLMLMVDDESDIDSLREAVLAHRSTRLSSAQQDQHRLQAEIDALRQSLPDVDALSASDALPALQLMYKVLRLRGLL